MYVLAYSATNCEQPQAVATSRASEPTCELSRRLNGVLVRTTWYRIHFWAARTRAYTLQPQYTSASQTGAFRARSGQSKPTNAPNVPHYNFSVPRRSTLARPE